MRCLVVVLSLCAFACGRVGFSARTTDGDDDGDVDSASDGATATTYYLVSCDGTNPAQLFTVGMTTGQLSLVGEIPASFGVLTGIAYWDSNTIYANTNTPNGFLQITLSPFDAVRIPGPNGDFAALEREGNRLIGVAQATNRLVSFVPGDTNATPASQVLPTTGSGGDLARTSDGTWYWWSSTTDELYTIDVLTGVATSLGGTPTAPFMTGLVATDDDQLHVVGQRLFGVDKTNGQIDAGTPVCLSCPTPYTLSSGDTTRTP